MTIKPLGKRILAKKLESEERKSPGGIVPPDTLPHDKVLRAQILPIGTSETFALKIGCEISVCSFAGTAL